MTEILQNALLHFETPSRIVRLLKVVPSRDLVILFDVDLPTALPEEMSYREIQKNIDCGEAHFLTKDPYLPRISRKVRERRQAECDQNYETIRELVEEYHDELLEKQTRGAHIRRAANTNRTNYPTILDRIRRHWRSGGSKDAQFNNYQRSGAPGQRKPYTGTKRGRKSDLERREGHRIGTQITPELAQKMARAYLIHHVRAKESLVDAHTRFLIQEFAKWYPAEDGLLLPHLPDDKPLPTRDQFRYWAEELNDKSKIIEERAGTREYLLNHRPRLHTSIKEASGPGKLYQIDATIADIYLRSFRNPNWIIGRPILYFVIDVFSRMIVGFAVTLEGPSWLGAMLALETVAQDKVELCEKFGVNIQPWQWPVQHLCTQLLADRGELLSLDALTLVKGLGILKSVAAPFRADWKGTVERRFRTINDDLGDWMPGKVVDLSGRLGQDYVLDARLNIKQFTKCVIECILYHNNEHLIKSYRRDSEMLADGIQAYPLDLWEWGKVKRPSGLRKVNDPEAVTLHLSPTDPGSYCKDGILFQRLWYTSEDSRMLNLFGKAGGRRKSIDVRWDPRLVDGVHAIHPETGDLIPCVLRDDDAVFAGCNFIEVADSFKRENQDQQQDIVEEYESRAQYLTRIDRTVDEARAADIDTSLSKAAQKKGIREHRNSERTNLRRKDNSGENSSDDVASHEQNDPDRSLTPTYDPRDKLLAYLQAEIRGNGEED